MKRMKEEQDAGGFSCRDPWRVVCPRCIADEGLRRFVERFETEDCCGFCGSETGYGLELHDLFGYMAECLKAEYDDPLNEVGWDGQEGGWMGADVFDSMDLLAQIDDPFENDELRDVFISAFEQEWCQLHPYRLEYSDALASSWDAFATYVREVSRFLFLRFGASQDDDELFHPGEVLDEIAKAIANVPHRVLRCAPVGQVLWRGRRHTPQECLSSAVALGPPPSLAAGENRMSPQGISVFYAAETSRTAEAEVWRADDGDLLTVAGWVLTEPIVYLDMATVPEIPSLFDMTARIERPWLRFLREFAAEISRPTEDGLPGLAYVPTQIFTEFVRHAVVNSDGTAVRAIRYRSSVDGADSANWVVFAGPDMCGENGSGALLERSVDPPRRGPAGEAR